MCRFPRETRYVEEVGFSHPKGLRLSIQDRPTVSGCHAEIEELIDGGIVSLRACRRTADLETLHERLEIRSNHIEHHRFVGTIVRITFSGAFRGVRSRSMNIVVNAVDGDGFRLAVVDRDSRVSLYLDRLGGDLGVGRRTGTVMLDAGGNAVPGGGAARSEELKE